jgi:WD40 repeat protein
MSSMTPTVTGNPFVGPRAFRTGERLHARERETQHIVDLLISERIVLLYSPSGAGKTSLINAALIPELDSERFQVSPVVRVAMDTPDPVGDGVAGNRYVLSTLLSLEEAVPPDRQRDLTELRRLTIDDYLRDWSLLDEAGAGNELLVFDQFEEILTADATDEEARRHFFGELGEALRDRGRWALFAMREEFVAGLDPYLASLPTKLRTRVRLDLLQADGARRAIQRPAIAAGREITDEAARRLVDELRLVNVQRGEERVQLPGPFVEPVQLQVVCSRLWDAVGPDVDRIDVEHVEALGDVERTLGDYYAERVADVAAVTGVAERHIRDWFDDELITASGFRAQLPHGPRTAGAAEPAVVARLEDAHLVRAEDRRGTRWIELAHDRLIEPVREDNARWRAENLSDLQRQAARWHAAGRKEELLLAGGALDAAAARMGAQTDELTAVEQDFWEASLAARRARRRQRRESLVIRFSIVLGIALLASLAAVVVAVTQSRVAEERLLIARSRQLAMEASTLSDERPETALLLALEGVEAAPTHEALSALAAGLARPMTQVRERWTNSEDEIWSVALSADGGTVVTSGGDGMLRVWDARSGEPRWSSSADPDDLDVVAISPGGERIAAAGDGLRLWDAESGAPLGADGGEEDLLWIRALAFSPDGASILSGGDELRLWDGVTGERRGDPLLAGGAEVTDVAFSPDGISFVSSDADGTVRIWDASSGEQQRELLKAHDEAEVWAVAFSPDGGTIASGGEDGAIRLWDAPTGQLRQQLVPGRQRGSTRTSRDAVPITSLAFGRDGALLVAGADDGAARFWDVADGALLAGAGMAADSVTVDPEGSTVVAASSGTLGVWEIVDVEQPLGGPTFTLMRPALPLSGAVAFSPDGRLVVAGNEDGSVQVWELASGEPRWRSQTRTDEMSVLSVAVSPAGDLIASGGVDGAVRLWDAADGTPLGDPLTGHGDWVRMVAFSPDGELVASGSDDGTVRLWDVASREPRGEPLGGHDGWVRSVAFSPDGARLASGADDGTVRLWDVATGEPRGEPLTGRAYVGPSELAFSPDGTLLASAAEGTVRLWELASSRQPARSIDLGAAWASALAFSADGTVLAVAADDGIVRSWDVASEERVERLPLGADAALESASFSPDGSLLVTGGSEVRTWDTTDGEAQRTLEPEDDGGMEPELVESMAFHPDGSLLVTAGEEGRVQLRDAATGEAVGEPFGAEVGWVTSVAFTDAGDDLLIVAEDEIMQVWDTSTGEVRGAPLEVRSLGLWAAALSPGGDLLASGGEDGTVRLWTAATGDAAGEPSEGHDGPVSSIAFDPAGEVLATGGADGTVRLWDVTAGAARGEPLIGHDARVSWVAFDAEGGLLASGDEEGGLRLWDVASGEPLHVLRRGDPTATGVVSLAVGETSVVAIGWDGTVQLWELTTGLPRGQLTVGDGGWVASAATSPDAERVAIAGEDGTVRILPTDPAVWEDLACRSVSRNLSQAEWEASLGADLPYRRTCSNHPEGPSAAEPGSTQGEEGPRTTDPGGVIGDPLHVERN